MTEKKTRTCSVEGCSARHYGQGYCSMHYQRVVRFGSTDDPKPADHGKRKKHPLFAKWSQFKRRAGGFAPEWADFWTFVSDVGERPEGCALEAIRQEEPIGPGNFEWRKMGFGLVKLRTRPPHCQAPGCTATVRTSGLCRTHYERMRARGTFDPPVKKGADREKRTKKARKNHLAANYGLTVADYEAMVATQGGKCAICTEEPQKLYVDHCHTTSVVRGLLCSNCNLMIGLAKDSGARLFAAIQYLGAYQRIKKVS